MMQKFAVANVKEVSCASRQITEIKAIFAAAAALQLRL
jgi:hypothetical protein